MQRNGGTHSTLVNESVKRVVVMTPEWRLHGLLWLVLTHWLLIAPAGYCISLQSTTVDTAICATAVQAAFVKMFMAVWEKAKSSGFFSQPISGQANQSVALIGQTALKRLNCVPTGFPLVPHGWCHCQLRSLRYSSVTWAWAELRLHGGPKLLGLFFVSPEPQVLLFLLTF